MSMAGCSGQAQESTAASTETNAQTAETTTQTASDGLSEGSEKTFKVGICQLVQHDALDAATEGFMDALKEEFGDAVEFDLQNAQESPIPAPRLSTALCPMMWI